jgi:hypothetical protein
MVEFVTAEEMPELLDIRQELLEYTHRLRDTEIDFLNDLEDWDNEYTVGQANWLRAIYDRSF